MESIWSKTESLPERSPLPGNMTVDTAVIGGGLAGVLTAYQLQRRGREAVVLEAKGVGSGQTKNTTAKITSQHGLIYHRLLQAFGEKKARQYVAANEEAIGEYEQVIQGLNIDCGFQRLPACLYSREQKEKLIREEQAARKLGIRAELCDTGELPFQNVSYLCFPNQAQFHPLQFLKAVSEALPVFEKTVVLEVKGHQIFTDHGVVSARNIVFATHYPFPNFPGFYFTRLFQERSYVLVLEGSKRLPGMYYGIDRDGLSLRSAEGKLLLGGGAHRTGKSPETDPYQKLNEQAKRFWPDSKQTAAYSAQDCMSLDGVPYIGRFSASKPYWYVATGFGKWGMTGSMAAACLLGEEIAGSRRSEKSIFAPQRFPLAAVPTLGTNLAESCKGLLKEVLYLPGKEFDWLPPGQGAVIRHCGKKRGAYKDEKGDVYLVSVRCPHLGCQLEWNQAEKSWDCPCHGSRFDIRGQLIDNPAQSNLKHCKKIPLS